VKTDRLIRTGVIAVEIAITPVTSEFWFDVSDRPVEIAITPVTSEFWFNVGDGAVQVRVSTVTSDFWFCDGGIRSAKRTLAGDRAIIRRDLFALA